MLAVSFAGCMHGDSGNAATPDVDQRIETQLEENEGCPDGECPEDKDGNVEKLPKYRNNNNDKCPDGKCPARQTRRAHRAVPLPHVHRGN